ncbi:MAG: isoprenylcysteine carboxylmethyltransferase family protein [Acidobacteria bacterium]|nr:isoprenylcysteine carboxylmethyltransferase family protein [Acidobacteriota bacterium]
MATLPLLLTASVPIAAFSLWKARSDYRHRGGLTRAGLISICAMLFIPNLLPEYATTYRFPTTPLDFIGVIIGLAGIAFCLAGVSAFRSASNVFCLDAGELTATGLYRRNRNPQYLGWFLFVLGFALNDWSLWCLAALAVIAVSLHLLVLVEEEHLLRVFGEPYREFCRRVPRYI